MKNDDRLIKQNVQDQFGKHAEKYVASESHAKGDDLDLAVEWLSPQPDWQVLDIATGGGHTAKKLSGHVRQVVASDLTLPMLEAAAGHLRREQCGNVLFVEADAEKLPFLADTFDAVTCRIAAHHFPNPHLFLREAARVLKPGGRLLLIDNVAPDDPAYGAYMNEFERLRDTSHVRCLPVREWEELAGEAGLRVENSALSRKRHAFPAWVRRTAATEQQAAEVERYICGADPAVQNYFAVRVEEGRLASLEIDEWRALLRK